MLKEHLPTSACTIDGAATADVTRAWRAIPPYARRSVWEETVRRDPAIQRTFLTFALLLSSHARPDGTGIRVTHQQLAAEGGYHRSTSRRALAFLQERRLLLQVHRGHRLGDGSHTPSEYALLVPAPGGATGGSHSTGRQAPPARPEAGWADTVPGMNPGEIRCTAANTTPDTTPDTTRKAPSGTGRDAGAFGSAHHRPVQDPEADPVFRPPSTGSPPRFSPTGPGKPSAASSPDHLDEPLTPVSTAHHPEPLTGRPQRAVDASTAHRGASTAHPDEPLPPITNPKEGERCSPTPPRPGTAEFRAAKALVEQMPPETHDFLMPGLHRIAQRLAVRGDPRILIHDLATTIRCRGPLTGPGVRSPLAVLLYRLDEAVELHQTLRTALWDTPPAPRVPSPRKPAEPCRCARGWVGEDDEGRPVACPTCKPRFYNREPLF